MFIYSRGIKIHASGFDELLENIFCLLLVVEAFSLQKVVRMLKAVVVGERSGELGQTLGDDEGQGSLVCCSSWVCRVRRDWVTEQQQQVNMADEACLQPTSSDF